ncbi:hypothetical protein, partial [Pseudonocardia sp. ICBG601]|uniref:hypothetical protein n=1 Tax=Pseudonocardia sp. ICBG601 TaxID=2846759 RepID=UPI001CF694A2
MRGVGGARSFTAIAEYAHDVVAAPCWTCSGWARSLRTSRPSAGSCNGSTPRRWEAALQSWVLPQLSAQPAA